MGTGDSSRVNQGYSPGSYLVDVKVMEDYGGGNSQSILRPTMGHQQQRY